MSYAFLIEMAWKSALVSGAALALAALLRSRSAADRGAVLRIGIVMLLLLPVVSAFLPALAVETPAAAPAPGAYAAPVALPAGEALPPASLAAAPQSGGNWDDPGILFLLLYLGGVAMVGGRLLAGLATLRAWTREAKPVTDATWLEALERNAGAGRPIRLLVSVQVDSPLSWGLRNPVILIDRDALMRSGDAEAIVAHEVAHVRRRDWLSLIGSRVAVALFWFNPLVWRLDREVAQQAEEAADSHAAARVEPARYAQTLLDWARSSGGALVPANAMASSEPGLARRVRAILEGKTMRRSGSVMSVMAMVACVAVAAPVAAVEFVEAEAPEAPEAPQPPAAPRVPPVLAFAAPPAPATPFAAPSPAAPPVPAMAAVPGRPAVPPLPPRHPHFAAPHGVHLAVQSANQAARAAVEEAVRAGMDEDEIAQMVEDSLKDAVRDGHLHAETARMAAREAARGAREGMRHGAEGMLRGADEMERGAEKMRSEGRRLRTDRAFREKAIRENAARGKPVTHEELIKAGHELEKGAEELREGAKGMRQGAEEMRRGHG
jgi:beta-lactamase regulating signal transducer with metallopeptidase domain